MRLGSAQAAIPESGKQNETFWRTLLSLINAERVIPIVGQELLVVEHENGSEPLSTLLARRVADKLGVTLPANISSPSLTQVAVAYKDMGDLQDVYTTVYEELGALRSLPIPKPLLKLARITPIRLFVTTTIDDYLVRAINQERYGGQPSTQVISYAPQRAHDLRRPLVELGDTESIVFYLMGQASGTPYEYAITEEDILEWVRSLDSDERPRRLRGELDDNHVLIIGSGYSDWLARFFIRLAQQPRLLSIDQETTVIADRSVRSDPALREFLSQFSLRSRLFYADPVAFVDELFERWSKAPKVPRPARPVRVKPTPSDKSADESSPRQWCVFVSYAKEDEATAERISNGLHAQQIPVWFDRWDIKGGDNWEMEIKEGLKYCSLFAPVISKSTLVDDARYFRIEWNAAGETAKMFRPGRPFIVPIVIDDTTPEELSDYPFLLQKQWERLKGGQEDELVRRIKALFRKVKNEP